jgi:osmotically-inducible protein OsmY
MITASQSARRSVRAVTAALRDLPIDELHIEQSDNRICLRGCVSSYENKRRAQELAERAVPETCIENELRVGRAAFMEDGELHRSVTAALAALGVDVPARAGLEVAGGIVRLRGVATDAAERRAIERAAWDAAGVNRVESHLSVRSDRASDAEVGRALNEYIERTLNVRPGAVVVEYVGGVACLSGHVSSPAQRQAIEDLVRWHDRVQDVVNNLRLAHKPAAHIPRSTVAHPGVTHLF